MLGAYYAWLLSGTDSSLASTPSSWMSPLLPASWVQYSSIHFERAAPGSLMKYGSVLPFLYSTLASTSVVRSLLLVWGCAEAAFFLFQKQR